MRKVSFYSLPLGLLALPTILSGQNASSNLSLDQAKGLSEEHYRQAINSYADSIEADWLSRTLRSDGYEMPFEYFVHGEMPDNGYPLYISLHGGGATNVEVNDQQWANQKRLYGDVDGVYFVPCSPTNTWDMWHREYIYWATRLAVMESIILRLA